MGNKSKTKWRLIWIAYLILAIPIAVPLLILNYLILLFAFILEKIGTFKEHLIQTYKPEDLE